MTEWVCPSCGERIVGVYWDHVFIAARHMWLKHDVEPE